MPPRATRCPVCGRELARGTTGELQWTVSPTSSMPAIPVPVGRGSIAFVPKAGATTPAIAAPSIGAGDLDTPGLPRDAYGRALLIAAVAMAVDLLAPWINVFGQRQAPAQLGVLMLPVIGVLALTVLPLVRPAFRARPVLAVMPVVVGGMLLSLSLTAWGIVTYVSLRISMQSQQIGPDGNPIQQPTYNPDVGMYLFILGSAVLIVCGYHVFLEAARRSAPGEERALTAALAAQRALMVATDSSDAEADEPFAVLSEAGSRSEVTLTEQEALSAADDAADAMVSDMASDTVGDTHGSGMDGEQRVALPGSAAWHAAPKQPVYSRQTPLAGGWQRQPRPHR